MLKALIELSKRKLEVTHHTERMRNFNVKHFITETPFGSNCYNETSHKMDEEF